MVRIEDPEVCDLIEFGYEYCRLHGEFIERIIPICEIEKNEETIIVSFDFKSIEHLDLEWYDVFYFENNKKTCF